MKFNTINSAAELELKFQRSDQAVDIDVNWHQGELKPHGEGRRSKLEVFCPAPCDYSFLIPHHRYLFKESIQKFPQEFWSEIIAFELGKLMSVPVPPAFVATDNVRGRVGALIEWFYDYPYSTQERFIMGGYVFGRIFKDFDFVKGKQHNFDTLISYIRSVTGRYLIDPNSWQHHWAKVFLLDAVIGNTDRHQDNWGVVLEQNNRPHFSPAYDNGSSLAREYTVEQLRNVDIPRYIAKGRHHIKWSHNDTKGIPHLELVNEFAKRYPQTRQSLLNCISIDLFEFEKQLERLLRFNVRHALEPERASFILRLVKARIEAIKDVI